MYKSGEKYSMEVKMVIDIVPNNDVDEHGMHELVKKELAQCSSHIEHIKSADSNREDSIEDYVAIKTWESCFPNKADVPKLRMEQIQFISDIIRSGLTVRTYSGRFMFGKCCPGVSVDNPSDLDTHTHYLTDNLGLGYILYIP